MSPGGALGWAVWGMSQAIAASLGGQVVDPSGAPVSGAEVVAVSAGHTGAATVPALTGPDGRFAFDVPADRYRVQASPPGSTGLQVAWAPAARDRCDGRIVEVTDGAPVDDMDLAPASGASIRGFLRGPDGAPVAGATVSAVSDLTDAREATSEADGGFALGGVAPGSVTVAIVAEGFPVQFFGGAFSSATVAPITVGLGDALDLGPVTLRPGVTVGGVVTAGAAPASGGIVRAYGPGTLIEAPIGPDGGWSASGLPPGDCTAWAEVDGFATTYYPDAAAPAAFVSLDDGEAFYEMDLALPPEAVVVGRLVGPFVWLDPDDPDAPHLSLSLVNAAQTVGVAAEIAADGTFRFPALHPGSYSLRFFGADVGAVEDDWRGDDGLPRTVEVAGPGVLDLGDVDVPAGGEVRGAVTDAATGDPIGGAILLAAGDRSRLLYFVSTGLDGSFVIGGLPPDTYALTVEVLRPCPGDLGWVSLSFPDEPNPLYAAPVEIAAGEVVPWDPALPPDYDRDGMDDRWERANGLDPDTDDGGLDPDRDGYSNLDEYLLGTDPHDKDRRGCGCGTPAGRGAALWLVAWLFSRRRAGASSR